ncbi:hypothetical protein ANCCEY_00906 [Ancylostoma ceylanicum]|uniref:Uncharacterized protein n=1 Tax=Ancylostoma ceylanicum TaxID=53326 RepID=A0A0D6MD32_9BILA|nr:hypothetical protein ANCCEY_00906 [Ancylostoma ceylanicum]
MHFSMQRLMSAQDEMRAQIEVLQRAVRNHYTNTQQRNNNVICDNVISVNAMQTFTLT